MKVLHSHSLRVALFASLALALLAAAAPCLSVAQEKPQQKAAEPFFCGHRQSSMMLLPVTVTDKDNHPIAKLTHDVFTIVDEKTTEKIAYFLADDRPASVGVLIDLSGSLINGQPEWLNAAIQGVWQFVQRSNSSNQYFVAGFAGHNELLTDWTNDAKTVLESLKKIKAWPRPRDGTALYDACLFGIEKMPQAANAKRVLLLITDGKDSDSKHRFDDVHNRLKETDVIVYTLCFVERWLASFDAQAQRSLAELSTVSGGAIVYSITPVELSRTFARFALELRNQYLIGYYPTNLRRDGKWRHVKVHIKPAEITDPSKPNKPAKVMDLKVRTREGYYAIM